jgi:hypothetical protein
MALLSKQQIIGLLERLGGLAKERSEQIELLLVGGAVMVVVYEQRLSTHDVDVVILSPKDETTVRELVKQVAGECDLSEDWLNDAAKGYLVGMSQGPVIFSAPGITVKMPSTAQLLAMKLCAWRDDVDIEDARRLLLELTGDREKVWQAIEPHLVPGNELKAHYAFLDLWESTYGKN